MSCYDTERVYIKLEDGDAPDYIIENVEEEGIVAEEVLEIVNINETSSFDEADPLDQLQVDSTHRPRRPRDSQDARRMDRLMKDAAAKREKIANETPEERAQRLRAKKEINKRYFENETPQQKSLRLAKKARRERRARLDNQLMNIHPDLLATVGIEIVRSPSGIVEMHVPWAVPPDDTEEEEVKRCIQQEQMIKQLLAAETPEMTEYRQQQSRSTQRPKRSRKETAEERLQRQNHEKTLAWLRRQRETPEQRLERLQKQRIRTQRNRELKSYEKCQSAVVAKKSERGSRAKSKKVSEIQVDEVFIPEDEIIVEEIIIEEADEEKEGEDCVYVEYV